jgi:two-component system, chemotaxis family, sensor kinase CheA
MTQRDELAERLRATFAQELDEQVRQLNAGLLALEKTPNDAETVRTLFRSAHTIKGAARVAGFPLIEATCHALESVFADVRAGDRTLGGSEFSLLFAMVDALAEAGRGIRTGGHDNDGPLTSLLPKIEALAGDAAPPLPVPAQSASAATPAPAAAGTPAAAGESIGHVHVDAERETELVPEHATQNRARFDADESVRVGADRLDALLSAVGELIIATGRIVGRATGRDDDARYLDRATDNVAGIVRGLRLRPFADVCEALPRAARDVAASEGREVELVLEGQDVEADRMVIDLLRDPLLHLVRNAVDHGIEPPAERERAGKPRAGLVTVGAEVSGGRLVVTVADDGRGVDEAGLRSALRARGRPAPQDRNALADALLAGGLSSRAQATTVSGRGVGIDIVRSSIDRLGGTVSVEWHAGRGTVFTLECPPSPATLRALLLRVGAHTFAVPTAHVQRLRRVSEADLQRAEGRSMLRTGSGPVPVHSLAGTLGPPFEARALTGKATAAILRVGGRRAAFLVDDVLDEDEIVVRPLPAEAESSAYSAGAAVLPSGSVALVLNASALLTAAARAGTAIAPSFQAERAASRRRVLVADDSITTRTLEQSVLEAAGYDVITAVDGEDAWRRLEQDGADAVVADVEMPRMDGFALCRRLRASQQFATLPIVLVTGLESAEDRARGMEAGADAYINKSGFDQTTLLETVNQLIGDE